MAGAFLVLVYVFSFFLVKKRTSAFKKIAQDLEMEFSYIPEPDLIENLAGFGLFTRGSDRKIRNLIHGTRYEYKIRVFDFSFKPAVRTGRRRTWQQTVFMIMLEEKNLPNVSFTHQKKLDQIEVSAHKN
jgi:hypothetical protein